MPSPRSRLVSIRFSHGASLSAWPYSEAACLGLESVAGITVASSGSEGSVRVIGAAIVNVAMIGAVTVGLNFDVTNLVLVAFAVWATNMRRR
jgi:hypothetical protein